MLAAFETDETLGVKTAPRALLMRVGALFRPHARTLTAATGLLLISTALQLAGPILIKRAIDVDIQGRRFAGLLATVAGYIAVRAVFLVLNYVQRVRLEKMGQEIILGLRRRLFAHLLSQSLSFFDKNPVGRLIARVQGDTDALRQMFASTVVTLVETVVLFAGMLAVMTTVSARLTLVVLTTLPPMIVTAWLLAKGGARRFREVRKRTAEISAFIAERIQGVSILQAFDRETTSVAELDAMNRQKFRAHLKAEIYGIGLFHGLFYFEILGLVLVLWFGGRWAIARTLSIGTLFMFIEYMRSLFEPVARLSEQLDVMQRAFAAAGRVFGLLDLTAEVRDPDRPGRWDRLEREIAFEDVWFSYRNDDEYALEGVSFRIPRGETWAIVGATGGGKSSILSLLLRFYDPQKGRVLVDGIDVRSVRQHDLRSRMALVLQDVYLFPGDILGNIAPLGDPSGDGAGARARAAARVAGAERFIERLPGGWGAEVAERGANFSAGERQLLSFARALAADPEILLLDEATAAVDPRTEEEIQVAMRTLLAGRTAIVIAHRLSTITGADGILVVQSGRIVERGRHLELLAAGGVYADLCALQFQTDAEAAGGGK